CAARIASLLKDVKVCGVAWGRTIMCVAEAIAQQQHRPEGSSVTQFVPLAGEPMNHPRPGYSSSEVAATLANAFGAKSLNLRGIGLRIPRKMKSEEADAIREYVSTCK